MTPARVLLVEDERIVALNLKHQLAKMGYTIVAAVASGKEALRQIEAHRPDVVLMDIHIEGDIDGIETTTRIRPDFFTVVIYLTAYAEETTLERARATKPYGYLLKPFSERELHATIQMALERRRADVLLEQSEQRLTQRVKERTAELEEQTAKRLKAELALLQAHKLEAIGRLSGGIAHDFNNLLMVIVGSLSLLIERPAEHAPTKLLGAALRAADRGAALVRQLLSFGRRQLIRPESINVDKLLGESEELFRSAAGQLVDVSFELQAGHAVCSVDREELERAILNIIINARQAMPSGGRLTVRTNAMQLAAPDAEHDVGAGDYIRIAFKDTGYGMQQNVVERAFEPFFTTREVGEGTGLGLSQAYGFAKQSGGHAAIESAVNEGTEVFLYLPRLATRNLRSHAKQDTMAIPAISATVLMVDDTPEVRETLTQMLEDLGCTVFQADNGCQGLALVRARGSELDLLLTDIVMPGSMQGIELAQEALQLFPALGVILMTGYASDRVNDSEYRVLRKPFDRTALGAHIWATLGERHVGHWS